MLAYAFKSTFRRRGLFITILTLLIISATLFSTANISARALPVPMLAQTLLEIPVDMTHPIETGISGDKPNSTTIYRRRNVIETVPQVERTEAFIRHWETKGYGPREIFITGGITRNSTLQLDFVQLAGKPVLGPNETFIVKESARFGEYPLGSSHTLTIRNGSLNYEDLLNLSLTVVGHVEIPERVQNIWEGKYSINGPTLPPLKNYFIVDLEQTFLPLLDYVSPLEVDETNLETIIHIDINQTSLIHPFTLQESAQNLAELGTTIENQLPPEAHIDNWISSRISKLHSEVNSSHISLLQINLLLFFTTLYLGITIIDLTFSLRRREVGLLLSKGTSHRQLQLIFLVESLLFGCLSSAIGIGLALLIVPHVIGMNPAILFVPGIIGVDTILLVFILCTGLAFMSLYIPARQTLSLPISESLREYVPVGNNTGFRKRLAWLCFGLGTYKFVIWLFGINLHELAVELRFTNLLFSIFLANWVVFDTLLSGWAPLLFFYGFTSLLLRGWSRFYDYFGAGIQRIFGDLGSIASKTIRRQRRRNTALVFISALLIGFSVQSVGILASNQDWMLRRAFADVGADMKSLIHPEKASELLPIIREIDGVRGATLQYTFFMRTTFGESVVKAINVTEWREVAYYEAEWFPQVPMSLTLEQLGIEDQGIILERMLAVNGQLSVGSAVSVSFPPAEEVYNLRVVGFFGPEPEIYTGYTGGYWRAEETWSYVSVDFLQSLGSEVTLIAQVLIALENVENYIVIVSTLQDLDGVIEVESAYARFLQYTSQPSLYVQENMMRLSVVSAYLFVTIGLFALVYLALQERRQEIVLMSIRGCSFGQTLKILFEEHLTLLSFAVGIGVIGGSVVLFGTVRTLKELYIPVLVIRHFYPLEFLSSIIGQLGFLISLLFLANILAILVEVNSVRYDIRLL